jgi:hypothetical protein
MVFAYGTEERPLTVRRCVFEGGNCEWAAKGSKGFDATFEDCTFKDGSERAFDQVRGGNLIFKNCKFVNTGARPRIKSRWQVRKECDIGLKAGMRDVTFINCSMNDLYLGDYSIYDQVVRPRTRRVRLVNCVNPNGGPIIVRGRYANSVNAENTPISEFIWPSLVTAGYWWFNRKMGDKRVLNDQQFVIDAEELG